MVANQVYKAYHRAASTVAKTQQIVMLYDGALRFLAQAKEAMEQGDIETRYKRLVRVNDIMMGLQASLDFDAGGSIANVLYDFYSDVDLRIFNLQQSNDVQACEGLIHELREMREIWAAIDQKDLGKNQHVPDAPGTPADLTGSNISA
jgi:flagellar protein FliS